MARKKAQVAADGVAVFDPLYADDGSDLPIVSLPVPLALQILLGNNGLPLGKFITVVGETECYKSTFAAELCRLHVIARGGMKILDAEGKIVPELIKSVISYDQKIVKIDSDISHLEDWQEKLTKGLATTRQVLDDGTGLPEPRSRPFCWVVDGMTSVQTRSIGGNIASSGHAELVQPQLANLISTYMKALQHQFKFHPITVVAVNHLKYGRDRHGNKVRSLQGGAAPRFHESIEFEISRAYKGYEIDRRLPRVEKGRRLKLEVMKNSCAPHGPTMEVELLWYHQNLGGRKVQRTFFDWNSALVEFLLDPPYAADVNKRLRDLLSLTHLERRREVASEVLGIPASEPVHYRVAGEAISKNPEIVEQLLDILDIQRRYVFQVDRDFRVQMEEARAQMVKLDGDINICDFQGDIHGA